MVPQPAEGRRGRLLVVGTPIGNLGDLSPRAAEALCTADLVVAEDTRVAARLLAHLEVRRPTRSFTEHNADARLPELLRRLATGETLALTTDAGMPAVSDPGARLVAAAREAGHQVVVVPGPTAVTAAISLAGVEAAGFVFGGFLPARPASARLEALERLLDCARSLGLPLVLYEAPSRVADLLRRLEQSAPGCRVAVGRELTKRHEEVVVGAPAEVAAGLGRPRGEFTLVVSELGPADAGTGLDPVALAAAATASGLSHRSVADLLRAGGMARREAYELAARAGNRRITGQ